VAKRRKVTPRQLDALMDEAARAWAPDSPGRLKDVVSTLLSLNDRASAVAHILAHTLGTMGSSRRAVYELMLAVARDWEDGRLKGLQGEPWDRLFGDVAVLKALELAAYGADGKEESTPTESDHEHDD
jgi:hypothetical protein